MSNAGSRLFVSDAVGVAIGRAEFTAAETALRFVLSYGGAAAGPAVAWLASRARRYVHQPPTPLIIRSR
jgi:hypothetical protein